MTAPDRSSLDDSTGEDLHPTMVLVTACLALFVSTLDNSVANVALPSIGRDLHAGTTALQWIIDSYIVVRGCLLLSAGALGDRHGRRKVFQLGLTVFGFGSLACSLAPNAGTLIAFRVLQATGGCFLVPSSLALVSEAYPERTARARAIGIWSATTAASTGLGPPVGGLLVDSFGWRSVFWINLPVVAVAVALAARYAPKSGGEADRRLDPLGQVLVAVALVSVISAFIQASLSGWTSGLVVTLFVVSIIAFMAFVVAELRTEQPLLEPALFRSGPFTGAAIVATTAFVVYAGFLFVNTLYLQDVRGYTPLVAGLLVVPSTAGNVVLSPLSGRMTAARGPRLPVLIAAACLLAGSLLLAGAVRGGSLPVLLVSYVLVGSGVGLVNTPITDAAVAGLPSGRAGVAGAVTSTFRQVGNSLGVALLGTLTLAGLSSSASSRLSGGQGAGHGAGPALSHAFVTGLQHAYYAAAGFAALTMVVAVVIFRTSRSPQSTLDRDHDQFAS